MVHMCVFPVQACLPDDAPQWMREMATKMGELEKQVVTANRENFELRQEVLVFRACCCDTHAHTHARARAYTRMHSAVSTHVLVSYGE